jgi:uncharacterized protein
VANGLSLAMPHVEPCVIASVRRVQAQITDPQLAQAAIQFVREEAAHHAEHRKWNQQLIATHPTLRWTDRALGWMVARVTARGPLVGTGFATGFELVGLAVVQWLAPRTDLYLRDAEPAVRDLFLWHLSEEVDHRLIAPAIHRAVGGNRVQFLIGLFWSMLIMTVCGVFGGLTLLIAQRRWWRPVAWWRLLCWAVSFLWVNGPLFMGAIFGRDYFVKPPEIAEWPQQRPVLTAA